MCWALRFGFEMGVVLINAFQVCFKVIARFPQRKSSNISPYFRGGNPAALHLKCIIARQTLFSPSFQRKNMAMGMPIFMAKSSRVSCLVRYVTPAGFRTYVYGVYWHAHTVMSWPSKVLKYVDMYHIHGETNVTWWHGSRQSHRDDCAHNIARICTYDNCFEHIPILQGQELSWLEMVTHVATRLLAHFWV